MKNYYSWLLVMLLIVGCSGIGKTDTADKANTVQSEASAASIEQTSSGMFAYIPYHSGKIEVYRAEGGKLRKVKEYNDGPITALAATPDGKYLYAIHPFTVTFTKYVIESTGELSNPVEIKPVLPEGGYSSYAFDRTRNLLFISLTGRTLDEKRLGSVVAFKILPDGMLEKTATTEVPGYVNKLGIPSSGKYLYADAGDRIVAYRIGAKGQLTHPSPTDLRSAARMKINGQGTSMIFDIWEEAFELGFCSVADDQVELISRIRMPYYGPFNPAQSLAFDEFNNALCVSPEKWLSVYKLNGSELIETNRFMVLKTNQVLDRQKAELMMRSSQEYWETFNQLSEEDTYRREQRAMSMAIWQFASDLVTVVPAPDGNIYLSSTSGIYRFKSTPAGLVFDAAMATWEDVQRMYQGNDLAPVEKRSDYRQITDGMILVQKK